MIAQAPEGSLLARLLESHPKVEQVLPGPGFFFQPTEGWSRSITPGVEQDQSGLLELVDNNPIVCADSFSVPSPASTLALIAFGPIFRTGLTCGDPVLQYSRPLALLDLGFHLERVGVQGELTVDVDRVDLGSVVALNVFVPVREEEDPSLLDDLYHEALGGKPFVRRTDGDWDTSLVSGRPWAVYDLRLSPGESGALLTIRVMADLHGKIGEAQMIHAFNVMSGFEETLGIPETLPA
ncbi:MAG: hypothetical protein MH204_10705 [Fimbriimonadaceae bacterium]|nr:hypothetical protein [Fimbriimonadaceae bacterium]